MIKIQKVLAITKLPQQEISGWTESTIVLHWLAQLPRSWTTFVANRVKIERFCHDPFGITSLRQTTLLIALHVEQHWNGFNLQVFGGNDLIATTARFRPKNSSRQVGPNEVRGQKSKGTPQSLSLTGTQTTLFFRHDQYSRFFKLILVAATVVIAVHKFKILNRSLVINTKDIASAKLKILQEHQWNTMQLNMRH